MKKKIFVVSVFLFLLLSFIVVINKKEKVGIIGDYMLNPLNENEVNYDTYFSHNDLTSNKLLEYLDYNAYDLKNHIKINKYIKSLSKIYLSIGMNDLLEFVNKEDNKLVFNHTLLSEKIALLEYNLHEIVTSISAIKDIEIYYFSLYYFNDEDYDLFVQDYNYDIKLLLEGLSMNYIEVNDLIEINDYTYTIYEQKKLYDYIDRH